MPVQGVRQLAREATRAAITAEARRQLATVGPGGLSLRAVARSVGMVSSGVYRYVASRDDLLTILIVEAYDSLGATAERAAARHASKSSLERWVATCRAIRRWARANRHEYALLYGTPVPGYRAPTDTIGPATRVTRTLVGIVADAAHDGRLDPAAEMVVDVPARLLVDLRAISDELAIDLAPEHSARAMLAWTQLFGMISFELFGHTKGAITAHEELFTATTTATGRLLGLVTTGPSGGSCPAAPAWQA
ncbi:MAG: TetR/AcrR family transcriptional regulator [Actinomycetota bacterium]|nr:TetR/AcrR family transcriptional regulator [Actinomycetota bacterium]